MSSPATALGVTVVVPLGSWSRVLPDVGQDVALIQSAVLADFESATGLHAQASFDPENFISGLGAEQQFFELNLADVIELAVLATPALAKLGKKLLGWLASVKERIHSAIPDEVDASKMQPMMGAPVMRLLAAARAMDEDSEFAASLTEWDSRPLFSGLMGPGYFHAQQKYLVVGTSEHGGAFIALYDAYGTPEFTRWA